jgi:hypothetical protein
MRSYRGKLRAHRVMIEVEGTALTAALPVIGKSRRSADEGSRATRESTARGQLGRSGDDQGF